MGAGSFVASGAGTGGALGTAQGAEVEHFVTLFDSAFLPLGLALHESLAEHAAPFHLWVIGMDDEVVRQLRQIAPAHLTPIALSEIETSELLAVKPKRSRGEYCWTVTPFTFDAVFERAPDAKRVTYLDADLFFFGSPQSFFDEFEASGKQVLITEHAYDPQYDQSRSSGRFCVQFLTFTRDAGAERVRRWWQGRCIEWCYARAEPERYGDQKYLDRWPTQFADEVHVLGQVDRTLAPWNARFFGRNTNRLAPVFFHFHGFRLLRWQLARLYAGYVVGPGARPIYRAYVSAIGRALARMRQAGLSRPLHATAVGPKELARRVKHTLKGTQAYARIA